MKLSYVHIENFRSCHDVELNIGNMHALVGANNAGKSTVLRALDFLFNPSAKSLTEETFWNKETKLEIRVEARFTELRENENEILKPYLLDNGDFFMARSATMGGTSEDVSDGSDQDDDKIKIGQQCKKLLPEPDWLQDATITGKNIDAWWKNKDSLSIAGSNFCDGLTKKPKVEEWRARAKEFIEQHKDAIPKKESWIDNPRGYANVLKNTLPFFVLVPAVRDVTEESKATKSNPFGKLLSAIVQTVTDEKKKKIDFMLTEVSKQMNRNGGSERVSSIIETEKRLNELLRDFFTDCDLEIEFETPTLEVLLSTPKIFVDDGFRNLIENKGHGLQRAVIFTILRRYAETITTVAEGRKRNLILAVEEPELYMHPQAQRTIRSVFRKIASGGDQVLFSTHSSLLVEVAYFDEIIRMQSRVVANGTGKSVESSAWQLPMKDMIDDLQARFPKLIGEITDDSMRDRYSHAYNPRRNEGFFASKIILVEGATEEYSLPIYADSLKDCAFDPQGISVVECGGKTSMDRLFRIFNELRIPCYILFDYDKGNSDKEILNKSIELLALVGQKTDPPASLFVSDRVACFPCTWEIDVNQEIKEYDKLAKEARKELGIRDDTGKPLVARYVARKLANQQTPFVPPSVKKIIEQAIKVKWEKSCLQNE